MENLRNKLLERYLLAIKKVRPFCKHTSSIFERASEYIDILVKALKLVKYKKDIPGHELEHTFRVLELSLLIGCQENADLSKLALAALLHDVGRWVDNPGKNHAEISAEITMKILGNNYYSREIAEIIREHSFSAHKKPSNIESAVLQDADKIDALGAIGVARVFAYGGYLGRPIYKSILHVDKDSLGHFYEKILKLPEIMNTLTGKKIAEKRVKKVISFLQDIQEEIALKDILNL